MSDGTIGNVKRMARDANAPTASLFEFMVAYRDDNHWWSLISDAHRRDLFETAIDELADMQERAHAADMLIVLWRSGFLPCRKAYTSPSTSSRGAAGGMTLATFNCGECVPCQASKLAERLEEDERRCRECGCGPGFRLTDGRCDGCHEAWVNGSL